MGFLVSALGQGSYSIDSWAGIDNWTGIHWAVADVVRTGAAVGIGAGTGLLTRASAFARRAWDAERHAPSAAH
jgi:hypothetical protein